MRSQLVAGWPGRIAAVGLILLTLGIGFCLFDGDEFGGHGSALDVCNGLALFSLATMLVGPAALGRISPHPAAHVHVPSIRRLDPPPRALFL